MAKKYTVTKKDRKKYNVSEAALAQRRNNVALIPARTDEERHLIGGLVYKII